MNKIVSLGLGDLTDDEHAKFEQCQDDGRNRNQHEAVLTMARVLKERLVGKFAATCKPQSKHKTPSNLSGAAVTVDIDDSQGFIDANDLTLVFSVSSGIPVKQIIADLARAAIVIWVIVLPGDWERGWLLMKHDDNET
ncbi:hypothetical protein CSHISOI_03566 [Colletotrichum shisoi]|uniref:Uncharacterized protein n=1 Tax=Colletotrichum shisoi TaxID=2078593 RepID=A0A5Q4C084_9PEZI|nr:hypothetical protein CSHISOI_03566 [Colletotrichum shisoi]